MNKASVQRRVRIPLILLAVFFLLLSAHAQALERPFEHSPSSHSQDQIFEEKFGDAIVISSIGDARTLIPILASDSTSSDICGLVFNGLVKYDKDLKVVGDLAKSWDVLDNGLTIVFHLRRDVRWHDGAAFTARDVEFTYKKLVDPGVKTPYSSDFDRIRELTIPDDYTVKVTYKEPFAPALSSWGMWIMPEHVLKDEDLNKTAFSRNPIGTGPYKFKSWKTGEKIELVSNHGYFEGRPFIDRCIYRIIPDEATAFLELETGGVDWSLLTPLQYTRQTENTFFKRRYHKFKYPSFGYTYLGYNLSDPKFSDIRVRRAINYAVNKKEIIDTIFFGLAQVVTGPFMIDSWAYDKSIIPVAFDPEKAKALLAEAGWTDANGDGRLEKEGRAFEFTVLVNQGNAERLRCAEMIQGYLASIGITMKIRVVEWSTIINEFINKRRFEAVLMGWFLARDPDNFDIWHSSKTREGEFNFIGYKNAEVDALLEEGRRTFDEKARGRIYRKIHRLIYDDQPYIFLYSADMLPVVNSRFRNVESSVIGIGYNFIKWYVPKNEQKYK